MCLRRLSLEGDVNRLQGYNSYGRQSSSQYHAVQNSWRKVTGMRINIVALITSGLVSRKFA